MERLVISFLESVTGSDTEPYPAPDQTNLLPHNLSIYTSINTVYPSGSLK